MFLVVVSSDVLGVFWDKTALRTRDLMMVGLDLMGRIRFWGNGFLLNEVLGME